MSRQEHLTIEGLSEELKTAFLNVTIVSRSWLVELANIDPNWLAGFVEGEWGCFNILISKSKVYKTGSQFQLIFILVQHSRDTQLMERLIGLLGCGKYYPRFNRDFC